MLRMSYTTAMLVMFTFHATDVLDNCNAISNVHFPCYGCHTNAMLLVKFTSHATNVIQMQRD